MTRLIALAAAVLALLAWLRRRDRPDPYWGLAEQQLEEDGVQPPDPVTWPALIAQYDPWRKYGTGDPTFQPWVNTTTVPDIGDTLEPLTAADRDWLDQTVRSHLHPAT